MKSMRGFIDLSSVCDWANDYLDSIRKLTYIAWVVIIVNGITGFTSFSIDLDMMAFFKYQLDMTNKEAGALFGAQGIPTMLVGIIAGLLVDKLGVKVSLIIGALSATLFGVQLALSDNKLSLELVVSFGLPFAGLMMALPLRIAAGRVVERATRSLCFMLSYWSNNVGDVLAAFLNPFLVASSGMGQFEKMFLMTSACHFALAFALMAFFKEPPVVVEVSELDDDGNPMKVYSREPLSTSSSEEGHSSEPEVTVGETRASKVIAATLMPVVNIAFSRSLWRCLILSFVFMWARMPFMHMMTIVPIYMQNLYGLDVNYSFAIATNPEILTVCLWLVSVRLSSVENKYSLMFAGCLFVALSPLPMVIWRGSSQWPVYLAIALQTVGEMLFSPLLDMIVNELAPSNHKGLYGVLAGLPHVAGRLFAGIEAGYLLDNFCPSPINENYNHWSAWSCENLWIPVMLFALLTCLFLPIAQPFLESNTQGLICSRTDLDEQIN